MSVGEGSGAWREWLLDGAGAGGKGKMEGKAQRRAARERGANEEVRSKMGEGKVREGWHGDRPARL